MAGAQTLTVGKLGIAVTISYASSYYLPAILARDIAASVGVQTPTVFLAFSTALLLSAVLGPAAGRLVDRHDGRLVLAAASLVFAAGLALLAGAQGVVGLFFAWLVIGAAMSAGFYEAAFSTLVKIYRSDARSAITGITLIAGFASTVGWPLTGWLNADFGWRTCCLVWAGIHLAVSLPLLLTLPRAAPARPQETANAGTPPIPPARATAWLLAYVFGVTWFVGTAMAAHLPALLQAHGVGLAQAVFLSSLVGPAQVLGRLVDFSLLRKLSPLSSARAASLAHAMGALVFMAAGVPAGVVFVVLHGMGNGVMTIANGTLPLLFFGPVGYGGRQGMLMVPARFAQALSPYVFGLAIAGYGASSLWISAALGVSAFVALHVLRMSEPRGSKA